MSQTWMYIITNQNGILLTTANPEIAEKKSKHGYRVLCKRTSNIYKYH